MASTAGFANSQSGDHPDAVPAPVDAPAVDPPREQRRPQARKSVRACIACRQMKMKCEGAENPPCVKCFKAGRECFAQVLQQNPYTYSQPHLQKHTSSAPSYDAFQMPYDHAYTSLYSFSSSARPICPIDNNSSKNPIFEEAHHRQAIRESQDTLIPDQSRSTINSPAQGRTPHSHLPSIYSTSPVDALNDGLVPSQSQNKRRRSDLQSGRMEAPWTFPNDPGRQQSGDEELNIPKRDLREMVYMFREKLLVFIPALLPEDFQNVDRLIETELPLVHCICYATARFLVDGRDIQETLLPSVTKIVKAIVTGGSPGIDDVTTFKALLILYVYADSPSPTPQGSEQPRSGEISYWPLKSLVEVYALRLSLYSSVQDLKAELQSGNPTPVFNSESFRRYTYWLQLFVMSHYSSLISGTPPSIRIDSTIRAAPALMREIGPNPQIRLFGEVELCLIWEKASMQQHEIGEWWCLSDSSADADDNATEVMLMDADKAIDAWYDKWQEYIRDGLGVVLDQIGRCARFCISSYAVRSLRNSPQELSAVQQDRVRRCVTYANRVLDWPLNLRPMQKEKLRYVSDSGSIMLKFCCLFIIASCQTFTACIPNIFESLDNVKAAAQLMMNLAQDHGKKSHIYSTIIFDRAKALRVTFEQRKSSENSGAGSVTPVQNGVAPAERSREISYEGLDLILNNDSTPAMDLLWDFSMLLPNVW